MGRKARYSAEEKISAVQEYLDGKGSMKTIAQRLGIAFQSFKQCQCSSCQLNPTEKSQ
ncbi:MULTISPECIES: transposase [unclassified Coprococcus]|uniref:transposase n=1 Tax=unclassified Coprococcus TaxID=2684943 RepID=UPI0022E30D8A|nr:MULTISPECIES: transposase [unclassified Coprococcus]